MHSWDTFLSKCQPCRLCGRQIPPGTDRCGECAAPVRGPRDLLAVESCRLYQGVMALADSLQQQAVTPEEARRRIDVLQFEATAVLDSIGDLGEDATIEVTGAMVAAFDAFMDAFASLCRDSLDDARHHAWKGARLLASAFHRVQEVAA